MNTEKILSIILAIGILGILGFLINKWYMSPKNIEEVVEVEKVAVLETNMGTIKFSLLGDKAPETVKNFVKLAGDSFYDGVRFHRVIKDFMLQTGDPLSKDLTKQNEWGTGGPGYSFVDEINDVKLVKGVVAMANSGPNTNGSQFFIVTAEATDWLDGKHTAFGEVIEGLDVVEAIEQVETEGPDRPVEEVVITKAYIQ